MLEIDVSDVAMVIYWHISLQLSCNDLINDE